MRAEFLSEFFDDFLDFVGIRETTLIVNFPAERHANVHVGVTKAEPIDRGSKELKRGFRIELADEGLEFLKYSGTEASLRMLRCVISRDGVEDRVQGRLMEGSHGWKWSQF